MRVTRPVPSALLALFLLACSRNENEGRASAPREPPMPSEPSAAPPSPSVAAPRVAAGGAPAGPLAELASPLPVIAGDELIGRIRRSGNKGVIVTAFASWCDPCREELPLLNAAAPKIANRGVPIWVVSMDEPEAVPAA